ncbi:MAG: bifunctional (p)ppGpp synthetase/guanosine-3',5'-bis(diphosphate) 3'-pyrophosphohydrolase, partial [Coriobacteriales bacterium]|nr:bifunctional (p)ppGpp synthetase/guanosine-3',5'-bis(diphosphate) 3'-pyrophosphohydrolase [Coriobacteriales bacterium]
AQLKRAYEFAKEAHHGQKRKSGEAFVSHPVQVALILVDLKMDVDTITAALLHDTVEDSDVTLDDIKDNFSEDVMKLVDGVTKITRLEVETLSEQQANTIRKMLVAMAQDIRVIVIKLADRLHNMRTLGALREDRRLFKAQETMEIYAPLAHRLGISSIKWELEDLAFYYLEPHKYAQIQHMVAESRDAREKYLNDTIAQLGDVLAKLNIEAKITGRPKHLYSIYQKMVEKGKDFSEIYDLIALRIIVDTVAECYSCLGAVHTLWRPMPGRFKDYIAMPKLNMYQSLHTTVIGQAGRPLEIQIRTIEMHRQSEYGVAAHWRYKGEKGDLDPAFDEQLMWLRQVLDWADDTDDPHEFMASFKRDLVYTEVFVFTPKGEVKTLRAGSTPIDFAYAIHTEVGNHCVGAKVNGAIVPLSYELKTGDRVEILTQKTSGPSRDWLNIVKTPSARQKIRSYFSKMTRGDDILKGREILAAEMRSYGLTSRSNQALQDLRRNYEQQTGETTDVLLARIGTGKVSVKQVAHKMLQALAKRGQDVEAAEKAMEAAGRSMKPAIEHVTAGRRVKSGNNTGVRVTGLDDVLVHLAHCCNPVPGDDIIGFVTRGRGVSVHRSTCPNAIELLKDKGRGIDVEWEGPGASDAAYTVQIFIEAVDRLRLLQDVTQVLADSGVNVLSGSTKSHKDGMVEMQFVFEVSQIARIDHVLVSLLSVEGVIEANRVAPGRH